MVYMGSKRRIAKEILSIILADRQPGQIVYDIFCGGANLTIHIPPPVVAVDVNKYLIALFDFAKNTPENLPKFIGKNLYYDIKKNKNKYPDWLVGYAGFLCSYMCKFFGGYADITTTTGGGIVDFQTRQKQSIIREIEYYRDIDFVCASYENLNLSSGSIAYFDPPYKDTTTYRNDIDYDHFYTWLKLQKMKGIKIFISEYDMPFPFREVWRASISCHLSREEKAQIKTEKLYTL